MKKPIIRPLTGIRFFAACYVILFHNVGLFTSNSYIFEFLRRGYAAVSLFFVLSGFILTYNYVDAFGSDNYINNKEFWLARILRIYPIYFVSIIVSLPLFFYFLISTLPLHTALLKVVAVTSVTIPLAQSWVTFFLGQLNAPAWALSVEAFLYFSFPFIAPPLARISNKKLIRILIFCWVFSILPNILFGIIQNYKTVSEPELPIILSSPYPLYTTFIASFPLFHLPQFVIGIIIALIYIRQIKVKEKFINNNEKLSLLYSITEILLVIIIILLLTRGSIDAFLNNGIIAPIFGLFFVVLAQGKGIISKLLSWTIFLILGEASYCIYIFQEPVRSWLKIIFNKFGYDFTLNTFILYLMVLVIFSLLICHIDNLIRPVLKKKMSNLLS